MGQIVRRLGQLGPGHDKLVMLPDPLKQRQRVSSGGALAPFLVDSMTDANGTIFSSHVPEKGGSWTPQTGYTPSPASQIFNNRLYTLSATGTYRNTAAAPSADYSVEATLDWIGTLANDNVGVIGRASAAANTFYFARWSQPFSGFQLWKCIAGINTQLGGTFVDAFTSGSRVLRLSMVGNRISMSLNGKERVVVTDVDITAAGHAGVRFGTTQTTASGRHITKIIAT